MIMERIALSNICGRQVVSIYPSRLDWEMEQCIVSNRTAQTVNLSNIIVILLRNL